ncbi:MAG: flavodoxin FldA [Anaerolineae bacterium]|nr:flavodoxin FldA [Anaerolineae bacterium]
MAMKIGLFYGSSTDNTEMDAELIKKTFEATAPVMIDIYNIGQVDPAKMQDYDQLIIGSPTWNIGQLQDDWDLKFDQLDKLDMRGKKVAMFAPGDQFGYPDNYCDAMGIIGKKLEERGAELVGFTDASDYQFENSLAVEDGVFLGLALDDDNQSEMTEERIQDWVAQLVIDFGVAETA